MPSSRRKSIPSRNTGSTSSRYILRSDVSVSLQSWPERIRQRLSWAITRRRAPSRDKGRFSAGRHLAGLRQRNTIAHAAPIGVLLHLAAHLIGDDGDALGPAERGKQGFVAIDPWPQHLDEAADCFDAASGPGVARGLEPCIEAPDIVPIGDRDHIRKTRLIEILGAVPMRRTMWPLQSARQSPRAIAWRQQAARRDTAPRNRPSRPG